MRRILYTLFGTLLAASLFLTAIPKAEAGWFDWLFRNYTQTKYPIVLAHGLFGFDSILGVIDYWPGIVESLEDGGATVFVTVVSELNSSEARGEQLAAQIDEILAITSAQKVNIIGHSQGALDARYVATVYPDKVASITSVGGPNEGGIGDLFDSTSGALTDLASQFMSLLADLIGTLSGNPNPNNVDAALLAFSAEGIANFNANYGIGLPSTPCGQGPSSVSIAGNSIRVYSWSGTGHVTTGVDPTDALMAATGLLVGGSNDGLVGQCDSHLGKVLRDNYFMNHLDEVNLMFGLVSAFEVNPKTLYRVHANRLKKAGL